MGARSYSCSQGQHPQLVSAATTSVTNPAKAGTFPRMGRVTPQHGGDGEGAKQRQGLGAEVTHPQPSPWEAEQGLPHRAAQRISELKRFLYLRISGVSLWGRMLVGLTFTTEILRASFSLACSCLSSSLVNRAAKGEQQDREG